MASHKHPPHRYDKRLWKAASAWSSFQGVRDACEYILDEHIQPDAPIYYPLVTAICVLYARPFKHSRGIESLSVQFVPRKFHDLHKLLILLRDQTAAHVDAEGARFQGLPANNVRLILTDGRVQFSIHRVKFNLTAVSQIRELASTLVQRMLDYSNKLASQYPNEMPDHGEYLIELTTGTFRRV
jgi:hypothetical protein